MSRVITSELRIVWITPDGYYFLNKQEAVMHCEEFNLIDKEANNAEENRKNLISDTSNAINEMFLKQKLRKKNILTLIKEHLKVN